MKPKTHWGFIIRDLFSGRDNYSLDIGRILWAFGTLVFIIMSVYDIIKNSSFNYINWGIGFASVLGAGGVALKLKETTEPNKNIEDMKKDKQPEDN